MGECSGPDAQRANAGEKSHRHHVLHGHISDAHAAALLDAFQKVLDKSVHPLAQALKHDKSQRDSQDGVKHAKGLSCIGPWRRVPVAWEESRKTAEISDAERRQVRAGFDATSAIVTVYSKSPRSAFVDKHDQARNLLKSLQAVPKEVLNRHMPQKCVCSLILFGLKDYGRRDVQLVWSFRRGKTVWTKDWKRVMGEPMKLLA